MLCDVELYFRIHKLHHSTTYVVVDTGTFWQDTPLLFALWHAYKYCLTMCYRKFLTFRTALEHPAFLDNPTAVTIRTHFHVGMMEQMVLSAFLISRRVIRHIRGALASVDGPQAIYGARP